MSAINDFLRGVYNVVIKTSKPIQTFKTISDYTTGVVSALYEKPIIGEKNQQNRKLVLNKIGDLTQSHAKEMLVNMIPLGSIVNAKYREVKNNE